MFKNYFKTALRNLNRNKVYGFINIAGLGIGLACCMLIVLYMKDEVSYDRFHKNAPNIYRLTRNEYTEDGKPEGTDGNTGMLQATVFKNAIPEIKDFVRVQSEQLPVKIGTHIFDQEALYADSNFFSMFSFSMQAGNTKDPLNDLYSVVLSEEVARRFFGKTDVIGKIIELPLGKDGAFQSFTITGIVPKSPQNSSIKIQMLLPIHLNERFGKDDQWMNYYLNTFMLLNDKADIKTVEAKMKQVYENTAKEQLAEVKAKYNITTKEEYHLQPLLDMHLSTAYTASNGLTDASDPVYSKILGGIALFILLIACINFINLTMARSLKRAKEIGIRKVVGGGRWQLIAQFLGESFFLAFCSFLLAIILVIAVLPFFNTLANKALSFSYLLDVKLIAGYIALYIVTSLLAGFYPALVLSGYDPVQTLYNRTRFAGKNYLSKSLVVLQFTLATFLIVATITIYSQFDFLTHTNLGYNDKNIVLVNTDNMNATKLAVFKNELYKNPSIVEVAGRQKGNWFTIAKADGKDMNFDIEVYDTAFLSTYQIPLLQGRNLSPAFPSDSTQSILINEAFAKEAGWKEPLGKQVDFFYDSIKYNVVGVVKNFHYESLHSEIKPQLFSMNPKYLYSKLIIKIKPTSTSQTLSYIEQVFKAQQPFQPYKYEFKDEINRQQYEAEEKWKQIIAFAAALTIFISCIGLFGLATLAAEKRIKEIGIRKVLGASVTGLTGMLSNSFLKLVAIAAAIAFPAAWLVMDHWLQNYPYRIELSIWVFAIAGLSVLFIALATVSYQAIKAAIANPVKSLRTE